MKLNHSKYLFNILILFIFSFLSTATAFFFFNQNKKVSQINPPKKTIIKIKSFVSESDFNYFLKWQPDNIEKIDLSSLSFIAIEELFNTSKLLVNILKLKKIKLILQEINPSNSIEEIKSILKNLKTENKYIDKKRDYILMTILFEEKKYETFAQNYENSRSPSLKDDFLIEYLFSLIKIDKKIEFIGFFKKNYTSLFIKLNKLESKIGKKNLKFALDKFTVDEWVDVFVFLVDHNSQNTINKLSKYLKHPQLSLLYRAEYLYKKKKYNRAKLLLKRINAKKLLGFKKRILSKIRIRNEKYDLVLSHIDDIKNYKKAFEGFLLNAAKLTLKDRPDLSVILFKKYINLIDNKMQNNTDELNPEYWAAVWKLIWLYNNSGEIDKAKFFLLKAKSSNLLSISLAAEYWLVKYENKKSKLIDEYPFSYYFVSQYKNYGVEKKPETFEKLFFLPLTKSISGIMRNIKILLKYGLVNDCENYIKEKSENSDLNISEKNYLKFIPLILFTKEKKYGKSIWAYSKNFKNYNRIQLPAYLSEIILPVEYKDLIYKYSDAKNIDPYLVMALIKQESTFNPTAKSPSKAYGLMQLLFKTARKMAKKLKRKVYKRNLFDPETNIIYGVEYLKELIDKYNGNIYYALAAYNAGDFRVDDWLDKSRKNLTNEEFTEMIPFKETRNYVKLIIRNYYYYKFYYGR